MSIAQGSVSVTAGQTYTVNVGAAGTVGAVVIANESPYSLNVSAGSGSQWIVAQTADLVPCNNTGFNGNLTITTDNYLSNAGNAPSFLIYFTAYVPGEAIRGTYPAPLVRLANGGDTVAFLSNDTNAAGTLVIETRPVNKTSAYFAVYNDGSATWRVLDTNGNTFTLVNVITDPASKLGYFTLPFGWGSGANPGVSGAVDDGQGHILAARFTAAQPLVLLTGNQETGDCGLQFTATAANQVLSYKVNFKTVMTNVPSSITLTVVSSANLAVSFPSVGAITADGFLFTIESAASGNCHWWGTYTTVGN